jgi:hypothetical protein
MWWMTTQKNGASALGLRILGLKRYETTRTMLHRLRRTMVRRGSDLLSGRVEVDECYVGGPEEDLPGRPNQDKTPVVVAVQEMARASVESAGTRFPMPHPPVLFLLSKTRWLLAAWFIATACWAICL